jgi:hypothetical protein
MTRRTMILLVLMAVAVGNVSAQEMPGDILLGYMSPLLTGSYFYPCLAFTGQVDVWAVLPSEPVSEVRFEIAFPELSWVQGPGEIMYSGAVDASTPGDNEWVIQFEGCAGPGGYVYLLSFPAVTFFAEGLAVCTFGSTVPQPTWTTCGGTSIETGLFDFGAGWNPGCFPVVQVVLNECPVEVQNSSWGTIKSRY